MSEEPPGCSRAPGATSSTLTSGCSNYSRSAPALWGVVSQALDPRGRSSASASSSSIPTCNSSPLVGSAYGLANRTLGAVSLLGPVRMDYVKALRSVRGAASELSRFVEEIYEEN